MKKITPLLLATLFFGVSNVHAQDNAPQTSISDRTITTAVPFLLIAGDARASGLAEQGVATSPDTYSQQWNPAKYAFIKQQQGVGLSYVPYLRELVNDINVGQLNYYNRINERSAFAGSFRYFNYGEIESRTRPPGPNEQDDPRILKPNQFSLDLTYALRLSERFSMGITGRYLRSDLKLPTGIEDASAANSFGVDISAFYQSEEISYSDFDGRWRGGINISNVGPKIKYDDTGKGESFIPTNLKLGGGFDFILDGSNKISTSLEFNKLLVPTPLEPDFIDLNDDGEIDNDEAFTAKVEAANKYREIGSFEGIFKSFGDAPNGFSEELKEVTWSLGAEYWYEDSFAFRVGYFNESKDKGFRKFFTLGAGFKYSTIIIDASYLFSTAKSVANPLEGSLRFSLAFNFGEEYSED